MAKSRPSKEKKAMSYIVVLEPLKILKSKDIPSLLPCTYGALDGLLAVEPALLDHT